MPVEAALSAGMDFAPLDASWAAQQRTAALGGWPSPLLRAGGEHRALPAEPVRPRSADPVRHKLEVPVDAGMAALGFMSDDANATAGASPHLGTLQWTLTIWSHLSQHVEDAQHL